MDDPVNKAYAAMPTRLYLVGLDGRVEDAGGIGYSEFKPDELQEANEGCLDRSTSKKTGDLSSREPAIS